MGRLGSREMTATSDLDLIVLYDFEEDAPKATARARCNPVVYYGRLDQRLISAITVPTRRGTLYAIDMRLRPSGNKGPAATQFKGFVVLPAGRGRDLGADGADARRPVAGDPASCETVAEAIRAVLTNPADPAASAATPSQCAA